MIAINDRPWIAKGGVRFAVIIACIKIAKKGHVAGIGLFNKFNKSERSILEKTAAGNPNGFPAAAELVKVVFRSVLGGLWSNSPLAVLQSRQKKKILFRSNIELSPYNGNDALLPQLGEDPVYGAQADLSDGLGHGVPCDTDRQVPGQRFPGTALYMAIPEQVLDDANLGLVHHSGTAASALP